MAVDQISVVEALHQWVPDAWVPGLTKLCQPEADGHAHAGETCKTPGKRPLLKRFNDTALERYRRAAVGEDSERPGFARDLARWRTEAETWLERGYNVGLVPPPGVVVLDCDTRASVLWVEALLDAGGVQCPVQRRTPAKAHFWLRYDPELLPLRATQLRFHLEGGIGGEGELLVIDLRVGGRSQAVVAPSGHVSGVEYRWLPGAGLPEAIRDVPMMPAGLVGALETLLGLAAGATKAAKSTGTLGADGTFLPGRLARADATESEAGHDRLRGYVNRLCRYSSGASGEVAQREVRARAESFARDLYTGRPDAAARLAGLLRDGGELDRLVRTGWERFGGRAPLLEDRTDQGYLDTLLATWGDRWRWVIERAEWRVWTPSTGLWERSFDELVSAEIGGLHRVFLEDALRELDGERRERLLAMSRQMRGAGKVRSVRMRLQASCAVLDETFDADPWLLACPGGWVEGHEWIAPVVLDLSGEEVLARAPAPGDYLTRGMGAPWIPGARSALWERFLEESAPDPELRAFLARAAGLTAVGEVLQHVFLFLHGPGGTGKSTFLGALGLAFGGYAARCDFRTFAEDSRRSSSGASPDVARLRGARLAVCSEIPDRTHLGARMKDLTGGDRVVGRHLFGREIEFAPSHTVWIAGNCEPTAEYLDTGVWRRMQQIPFEIVHARSDVGLPLRLSDPRELAGIIGWIVRGWGEYRVTRGLSAPKAVTRATAEFRSRLDPLAGWLEECAALESGSETSSGDAWTSFQAWTSRLGGEGERVSQTRFSTLLKAHGVRLDKRPGGKRVMCGIRLVASSGVGNSQTDRLVLR